jgi:hypothetical protein
VRDLVESGPTLWGLPAGRYPRPSSVLHPSPRLKWSRFNAMDEVATAFAFIQAIFASPSGRVAPAFGLRSFARSLSGATYK